MEQVVVLDEVPDLFAGCTAGMKAARDDAPELWIRCADVVVVSSLREHDPERLERRLELTSGIILAQFRGAILVPSRLRWPHGMWLAHMIGRPWRPGPHGLAAVAAANGHVQSLACWGRRPSKDRIDWCADAFDAISIRHGSP